MKVTLKDVSYTIDGRSLVDSISLEIPTGTTTAVIGPNGAGKSTLLHLIAGDIAPSLGAIWYDSDPPTTISPLSMLKSIP